MPAVAALPQPTLTSQGWETYSAGMDAQLRNAIYGYLAEDGKQEKAAYMREVVLPGLAQHGVDTGPARAWLDARTA